MKNNYFYEIMEIFLIGFGDIINRILYYYFFRSISQFKIINNS